jgi:hypothetical protein
MDTNKQPKIFTDKVSIFVYIVTLFVGQLLVWPLGRSLVGIYAIVGIFVVTYVPMLLVEKICSKLWGISPNPKQRRISFLIYLLVGILLVGCLFLVKR